MKCVIRHFIFAALLLGAFAAQASAQYMYLDTDGDGEWTTADRLNANGVPTTVNIYVNTNHNKDGSLATCNTADGDLGFWNSYVVNLEASGGTVAYTNAVNAVGTFTIPSTPFLSSATQMTFGERRARRKLPDSG